ncbi:hypothetical protein QZH41_006508 [Actinostola sp. cb2023]|nr:hypothetical protein QZH41_006508 [Actinostola sp. cb2023]
MLKEFRCDVWTQDIAFYLDGTGFAYKRNPLDQALAPKARVWRKRCEGLDRGCTAKGQKTGTGGRVVKLMVAISFDKGVITCKAYDKLNGPYFAKFIDDNCETMFVIADKGQRRLWLQDGDPSQNSAMARAAMARANCELLSIPPRSPDLNPIENVFKLVSDALREQAITSQIKKETYEEFQDRVITAQRYYPPLLGLGDSTRMGILNLFDVGPVHQLEAIPTPVLPPLDGIVNNADDITVVGRGEDMAATNVHHERLKPSTEITTAVFDMPQPQDKAATRRFLGIIAYLFKFCPHLSEVVRPLRNLTHIQ